jgi:hypothetical protein
MLIHPSWFEDFRVIDGVLRRSGFTIAERPDGKPPTWKAPLTGEVVPQEEAIPLACQIVRRKAREAAMFSTNPDPLSPEDAKRVFFAIASIAIFFVAILLWALSP